MAARSLVRVPLPNLKVNTAGPSLGKRFGVGPTPPASPGVPNHSSPNLVRTKSCPFPTASLDEETSWPLSSRSIANAAAKRTLPDSPTKTQALASRVSYPTETAPEEALAGPWQQVASNEQDQYSAVRRRLWHTLYRVHSMDMAVIQERTSESEGARESSNAAAELERAYGASGGLASSTESLFAVGEEPVADLCLGEQCVTAVELGTAQALADWLAQRLPVETAAQVPQWGLLKGTKPVANLFQELQEGEISLEDGMPPRRTVHVASVKILSSEGLVLVESHQSMGNGTRRPRNRPLSEKMKPGEGVEAACLRGIYEELGSELGARDKVRLLPGTYEREEEERESCSYPGLPTRYVLHSIKAVVRDLPERAFETVENEGEACCSGSGPAAEQQIDVKGNVNGNGNGVVLGGRTVGVRTHHWVWRREEEIGKTAPD